MGHQRTIDHAVAAMRTAGVDALLIGPGADLRHLTGYAAHALERMTLLVLRADGRHALVVPELERAAAVAGTDAVPVRTYAETADPADTVAEVLDGVPADARLGVGDQLWARFLLALQQVRPGARWQLASHVTRDVRMVKDAAGLDGLRRAGAAIDAVHRRMGEFLVPGRTEQEAGRAIAAAMREEGHDDVDFVIVGSGPNGASPHHETSDRVLSAGDAVVVDTGGPVAGWFSDCTRNYVLGSAPDGYEAAHQVLWDAQRAAVAHVRPGVTAASVDAAARQVIADAGYGDAFIHRTGHGIGLEVHEEPYITAGNDLRLQPGMTFSVEPGIYLEGRYGMRIEDIVAVTEDGVERLNTTDTALVVLPA
ncbi:M24 family metallopeptidase [Euzebya sp.]|uniref:M24 family metallopeptidase n=1 Tax=Euzebya sp. TaxID=1971409 RepID=UPI003518512A